MNRSVVLIPEAYDEYIVKIPYPVEASVEELKEWFNKLPIKYKHSHDFYNTYNFYGYKLDLYYIYTGINVEEWDQGIHFKYKTIPEIYTLEEWFEKFKLRKI